MAHIAQISAYVRSSLVHESVGRVFDWRGVWGRASPKKSILVALAAGYPLGAAKATTENTT
jgi:hypothetical protein